PPCAFRAHDHRLPADLEDLSPEPNVNAYPRVVRQAVVTSPPRVLLERDQRKALLPDRPYRRNERRKAVLARNATHALDHDGTQPFALASRVDDRHERGENVRVVFPVL